MAKSTEGDFAITGYPNIVGSSLVSVLGLHNKVNPSRYINILYFCISNYYL